MKQTWRWFGPNDPISLSDLHMAGVEGIVTALHDLPPGEIWSSHDIKERRQVIESAGFTWDVIESLPVSEAIKTQGPEFRSHIEAYKESLCNVASEGPAVVCYNFMPILDWTRTTLRTPQPHGGNAMSFDLVDFAAFDLWLLERTGAKEDYNQETLERAEEQFARMPEERRADLTKTIVMGLPGANDGWTIDDVRARISTYDKINSEVLRSNLIDFLSEVAPVADQLGIRLCCHPDDPPFPLLGLPRIMSSTDDYSRVLEAVDLPSNGATLCTGSLGVADNFDPVEFIQIHGDRIHFVHLRNTSRSKSSDINRPNFFEDAHLEGDTDMVATVSALMSEESRRKSAGRQDWQIPMRPDHGQELLTDRGGHSLPGYPLLGRLRGLAELRGIMHAVQN